MCTRHLRADEVSFYPIKRAARPGTSHGSQHTSLIGGKYATHNFTTEQLMLRMFEESRELGERSIRGSSAHRIAVNMFNLLVAMNDVLNTSDEVLKPAHELKTQMQ